MLAKSASFPIFRSGKPSGVLSVGVCGEARGESRVDEVTQVSLAIRVIMILGLGTYLTSLAY